MVLVLAMVLGCTAALAEEDVFARFQPYTNVDLSVFKNAGYTSYYDQFKFSAELYPSSDTIEGTVGSSYYDETYTISVDLKLIYSAGTCYVVEDTKKKNREKEEEKKKLEERINNMK